MVTVTSEGVVINGHVFSEGRGLLCRDYKGLDVTIYPYIDDRSNGILWDLFVNDDVHGRLIHSLSFRSLSSLADGIDSAIARSLESKRAAAQHAASLLARFNGNGDAKA